MFSLTTAKVESTKKAWGETRCLMRHFCSSAHHASIKKGGYSSRHKHVKSDNIFYVLSGTLKVSIYADDTEEISYDVTIPAGGSLTVPPGRWHRFEALTDVELIETYNAPEFVTGDDIVRADEGGLKVAKLDVKNSTMGYVVVYDPDTINSHVPYFLGHNYRGERYFTADVSRASLMLTEYEAKTLAGLYVESGRDGQLPGRVSQVVQTVHLKESEKCQEALPVT